MIIELTFAGLLISLVYIGLTGLYPGGIIVPGYLVLYLNQPVRLAMTIFIALLTVGCYRLVSRRLILFGRRRLVFMLMTGGVLVFASWRLFPLISVSSDGLRVIGWIIPGLIANHFERQGIVLTLLSLITVTLAVYLLGLFLRMVM